MQQDYLTEFLGIQGFRVSAVERIGNAPGRSSIVRVHLERTWQGYICGKCGRSVSGGVDHTMQEVRHLTWWHHQTLLRFPRFRVDCPDCGVRTEALDFVDIRGPRVTRFLAAFISELCKVTTVKAVAILYGMQRRAVKDIDKQAVAKVQAERPLDGITVLGSDEVGMGTGRNKLWSLFSALEGPRGPEMLYIVEGRSEKKLKRFWRWFGKERASLITHAVLDMCRTFANSFRKHCPGVTLIFDKFHVVRHLNNALNEVRKAELGKALGRFKKALSGKKFVLLKQQARVRGKAREALDAILAASPKLLRAHLLKEVLRPPLGLHLQGLRPPVLGSLEGPAQVAADAGLPQVRQAGGKALGRHPRFLRQEGLARVHRVSQFEGSQCDPQGLRLPGQRVHEAQDYPGMHSLDSEVSSLDGNPQFPGMSLFFPVPSTQF